MKKMSRNNNRRNGKAGSRFRLERNNGQITEDERLLHRRSIQKIIDQQSSLLRHSAQARGMDAYYEKALAMLDSPRLREAFNLSAEPDGVRALRRSRLTGTRASPAAVRQRTTRRRPVISSFAHAA